MRDKLEAGRRKQGESRPDVTYFLLPTPYFLLTPYFLPEGHP